MLICCGLTTLDLTQVVREVPRPNQKVVAISQSATFGGPAANAAATAVARGVTVRLVTAVGHGVLAEVVRAELTGAGVEVLDVTGDRERGGASGEGPAVSTVLVTESTGERAVVSTNAEGRPVAVLDRAGVDRALSDPSARPVVAGDGGVPAVDDRGRAGRTVLLLDGHHPEVARALAHRARVAGHLVVLDGGSWKHGTAELVALCDGVVVSEDFRVPGVDDSRTLEALAGLGPTFVARSRGAKPIEVRESGTRSWLPVPEVDVVVDTLGAGDVLHGAFAAELVKGTGWQDALSVGAAVASRSVGYAGARGWVGR